MPRTPAQRDRITALMGEHTAVGHLDLGQYVSAVARETDGVSHAEVIDLAGEPLELAAAVSKLAGWRRQWERMAAQATEHLIAELGLAQATGAELNLAEVAREAGLSRQTLYNRLAELELAGARAR